MDYLDLLSVRRMELQPEVPSWAKAEQMEASVPQFELWGNGIGLSRSKDKETDEYREGKAS